MTIEIDDDEMKVINQRVLQPKQQLTNITFHYEGVLTVRFHFREELARGESAPAYNEYRLIPL